MIFMFRLNRSKQTDGSRVYSFYWVYKMSKVQMSRYWVSGQVYAIWPRFNKLK